LKYLRKIQLRICLSGSAARIATPRSSFKGHLRIPAADARIATRPQWVPAPNLTNEGELELFPIARKIKCLQNDSPNVAWSAHVRE
jgi:hypothetical protein